MGSTSVYFFDGNREKIKTYFIKLWDTKSFDENKIYKPIYISLKPNEAYLAIDKKNKITGENVVFGVVIYYSYKKKNNELYYKIIEETSGPCTYNAPKKLLKLLTDTNDERSIKWRKECWKRYKKDIPEKYI